MGIATMGLRVQAERELGEFLADGRATAMFAAAALDTDIWQRARQNPRRYFEARGVRVPSRVTSRFVEHARPDPADDSETRTVLVRCWWVMARQDEDDEDEPPQPLRFCLEVPAALVSRFTRLQR
jgi:hypothetical protein